MAGISLSATHTPPPLHGQSPSLGFRDSAYLGPEVLLHGQPCTALITVRSMAGVILVGLPGTSFSKNNPYVHEEYARLSLHCLVTRVSSVEGM